jgi:hypothetical protein
VAVCLTDGTIIYRRITDIAASGGNSVVTVNAAWGTALSSANVARISRMPLSRFASDDMTTSWRTPAHRFGAAQLSAGLRLMAFEDFEASRELGDPVQLFFFKFGPGLGDYYAYTDHTEEVVYSGVTYAPIPIERDNVDANGTLDKSTIKISLDVATDLAEIFRVYPPAYVVNLIIRQGHLGDPDEEYLVIWAGRVVASHREGGQAMLDGEPISTSMRRPGLRRNYQYGCPLVLYSVGDGQCNADKASKTLSATVASLSGATVTLTAGWNGAFAAAKFLGGYSNGSTPTG